MKKKVRLSRPGYKKGGAPHIAEQNETIDSISSGKRNVFLDRISNAAQEQMMNQAMMEAEEQFVPPQLYNYGGVPYYNVGGNFGFAMNPQAMANQSMYANALSDANADASNTGWFDNFGNIDFGKSEQMNIDPTTKEAKSWYKDYSKGYNKAMRRMNRGQSPFKNAYGGTPNYYEIGGPYDGGYGTHGTQSFEDYERWGNNSDVNAAVAPFWKSAWNDMWGIDNSMSRRAQDIRNTPGANVSANIGGNGSSEGLTMWEADKLERERKQRAEQDYDYKKALFDARRQQANQANNTSTQDVLNNTQSMIEGVDPYAAAQFNAQNIANNAQGIIDRSNERDEALNVETTTTNVDDALKGKTKKTKTASTASTDDDRSTTTADETADETTDERDLTGSMRADDINGTSVFQHPNNTGTNTQGIQGNWLKAKGFRGAPVFMPIPSMNGQAGLTPGWDYTETRGGFMTPFKKQRRWSYNPQTRQNEPVSEAGDSMNQSGPNFNPELNVSNNQNQNVDYFGEKRTLGERARNMRNRFRRNEKLEGFAGDSETDVMLPGGIGAASEQGNMQFTNREPSAQYENPVPDYNTGYNQKQDDPNYIPEGGVSGPNNEYGEGWTQAEIDEFKEIYKNQRYGGVPNYFHGGVAHEPPPGFLEQMAKGVQYAIPDANTLNKIGQGVKGVIPYLTPHNPGQALVDQTLNNKDIKIGNRGFEDFNMLYDDPTSKAIKPFNNNTWTANQRLSPDAKAIAAAQRAEKLYNSYKNSNTPNQQYGGVVQELTQPEIDQILAMGGKVEYLD